MRRIYESKLNRLGSLLSVVVCCTVFSFSQTDSASADFRICNDTKSLVGVSLGYRENAKWVTEGWWQVPSETCASLVEGDLNSRYYYLYAEDADRGGQWRGDIFMCTSDTEFKIDGVENCFSRGFRRSGFQEVDTNDQESWMVQLTAEGLSANTEAAPQGDGSPPNSSQ